MALGAQPHGLLVLLKSIAWQVPTQCTSLNLAREERWWRERECGHQPARVRVDEREMNDVPLFPPLEKLPESGVDRQGWRPYG